MMERDEVHDWRFWREEYLNALKRIAALEAQLAVKCATCPDLGMAALVERLQVEQGHLMKELDEANKRMALAEAAKIENCASGCPAIHNHLHALGAAQEEARLQRALDRIEAAGETTEIACFGEPGDYKCVLRMVTSEGKLWHVEYGKQTRAEAAESAATWAERQKEVEA